MSYLDIKNPCLHRMLVRNPATLGERSATRDGTHIAVLALYVPVTGVGCPSTGGRPDATCVICPNLYVCNANLLNLTVLNRIKSAISPTALDLHMSEGKSDKLNLPGTEPPHEQTPIFQVWCGSRSWTTRKT